MADLPQSVEIAEEGPREGFQIEPGPIPTGDKVALVDALSATGLRHIQVCSFVNPKLVPGWADAEAVVRRRECGPVVRPVRVQLQYRSELYCTRFDHSDVRRPVLGVD